MQTVLSFKMLKLTNCPVTAAKSGQAILLSTMRRYIPRIQVIESDNGVYIDYNLRKEFYFPETEFMAVSQYRNRQITQLKIDANPFAKAYRSDGLHGQAKRRRLETTAASEYLKTPEVGPPSNGSSMEDSLVNSDETDVENNVSSNEQADELSPEEGFNCDERQVNGARKASPNQTGLCKDVLDVHNKIQNETNSQESLSIATQVTQHQSSNSPRENDLHLKCEESREWMWRFDEQMSFRYASNGQLEGLFKYGDSLEDPLKNSTDTDVAAKATVNRRKKYLPRRLQRMVSSTNVSAEGITESEPSDEIAVNQVDLQLQPNDKTSISGDDGKEEQFCSTDDQMTRSSVSPCFEPAAKPSITCENSLPPHSRNFHSDEIRSKSCAAAEQISMSSEDGLRPTSSVSGESLATPAKCMLSTVTPGPGNTTGSSLTALMQMCSEAESGLDSWRAMRQSTTATRDISKKLQMPGTSCGKDIFPGELEEARMSSSKVSKGPVASQDGGSLFEQQVETCTTSSCCQLSQEKDYPLSSGGDWVKPSLIPTSFSGHVTSSDITTTSPVFSNYNNNSRSTSINSFVHATSSCITATPPLSSNCSSDSHSMDSSVRVTSSDVTATPPVFNTYSSNSSHSMNSFVYVTSSDIAATPPLSNSYYSNRTSMNSFVSDTVSRSPTTTYPNQMAGSTAGSRPYTFTEEPFPMIVDTFSRYYIVNGHNSGQVQQNKQQGYRPIIPAPNQSVNVSSDEPASDASVTSSFPSNSIPFPIIIDSFSINENFRAALAHRSFKYKILESHRQGNPVSNLWPHQTSSPPQVNQCHFSAPYLNETGQFGYIALDNTVLMKAFPLEKFYSFSAPAVQHPQPPSLRPLTRCYRTTRTNFSRMSLEPICSVIHPPNGLPHQLTSSDSATEVANQRAWGWRN